MNIQTVYTELHRRAKAGSIICGILAGALWGFLILAVIALVVAGSVGGSFLGRLGDISGDSIMGGYQAIGDLFMSAMMGVAVLVLVACIFILSVPAVLYTIGCVNGFSKAKKEQEAMRMPGMASDFRMLKADAVYKVVVSGLTMLLALGTQLDSAWTSLRKLSYNHSIDMIRKRAAESVSGISGMLLFISPVIVIFVLAVMNLSQISKWRKWILAVRMQNGMSEERSL